MEELLKEGDEKRGGEGRGRKSELVQNSRASLMSHSGFLFSRHLLIFLFPVAWERTNLISKARALAERKWRRTELQRQRQSDESKR